MSEEEIAEMRAEIATLRWAVVELAGAVQALLDEGAENWDDRGDEVLKRLKDAPVAPPEEAFHNDSAMDIGGSCLQISGNTVIRGIPGGIQIGERTS